MTVSNVLVLFLKQKSGSRLKARRMKKAFNKASHAASKVKELFNFFQRNC